RPLPRPLHQTTTLHPHAAPPVRGERFADDAAPVLVDRLCKTVCSDGSGIRLEPSTKRLKALRKPNIVAVHECDVARIGARCSEADVSRAAFAAVRDAQRPEA